MNISSVADIIPGFVFRGPVIDQPSGRIAVVQASNIDGNSLLLDPTLLKRIDEGPERANAFVKPDDVLVAARGSASIGFKAVVAPSDPDCAILATSSVYIVRLKGKRLKPEYLAAYINSQYGQAQLSRMLVGGVTRAVRRADIAYLEVPVPALERQEILIALYHNLHKQVALRERQNVLGLGLFDSALQCVVKES